MLIRFGMRGGELEVSWKALSKCLPTYSTFGLSKLDFNGGIVTINYWSDAGYDLGAQGSFICDVETGEIILYTNGCRVWDAERSSLTEEDFLMDDWASPIYCPKEHPTYNASLLLPSLQNDTTFYLVQKDVNYSEEIGTVVSERLFIHTIIKSTDGEFFLQNMEVVLDTVLVIGHLTAGPNLARDKWWFSVTEHGTNRHFMYELGGEEVIGGESAGSRSESPTIGYLFLAAGKYYANGAFGYL